LTDAVIVLPSYLDRLQAGHEDLPILLLPTLNELRASYDESLLSEGTLFAPNLDQMVPELSASESDAIAKQEFEPFATRVRNQYQSALLGWLKEQSNDERLPPLRKVCETLYIRVGRNELRRLWWIASLVINGLRDHAIDNDLPLRRLFARLDLTLKAMTDGGEDGPSGDSITALSRALLFHAAQARPGSRSTDNLRNRFHLEELIPDRDALLRARGAVTGRDAGLFHSIGEAVREELALVKDVLDMELRTGRVEEDQRESSRASLQQLADTLSMLNLPVAAKAVEDLLPELEDTQSATDVTLGSPLLVLAQKLLEVESVLDTHIKLLGEPADAANDDGFISLPPHEQQQIISSMLDEAVDSLHLVQEAVRKRLEGDEETDYRTALGHIAGALHLAGQEEVSALTEKLERAVNAELHHRAAGSEDGDEDSDAKSRESHLIPLTDAIAALELYLTGCRDGQANSLRYLEIMHSRLEGIPETSASGESVETTTIELPSTQKAAPAPVEAPARKAAPAGLVPTQLTEEQPSEIDPAMLEVFLEEFETVDNQLTEQLARWLDDISNRRILLEMRRGFHTLKGSGRMVGANEIGNFSWRFEELLNSVSDGSLEVGDAVRDVLKLGIGALPLLKARLLQQASELSSEGVNRLGGFAASLSQGGKPPLNILKSVLPASLMGLVTDAAEVAIADTEEDGEVPGAETAADQDFDPVLLQAMTDELTQQLAQLEPLVAGLESGHKREVSVDLERAVHTMAGTLGVAPLGQEAELAHSLEKLLGVHLNSALPLEDAAAQVLRSCADRFGGRLSILKGEESAEDFPEKDEDLLAALGDLIDGAAAHGEARKAELEAAAAAEDQARKAAEEEMAKGRINIEDGGILAIFLEEAVEVLERCDTLLNSWRDKLSDQKLVQNLQREIHTFKGGARMAGLDPLGELSHAMESLLERIAANRLQATVAAVQALEEGCDRLTVWVEQLQLGQMPEADDSLARFEHKAQTLSVPEVSKPAVTRTTAEEPQIEKPAARVPEAVEAPAADAPGVEAVEEIPAVEEQVEAQVQDAPAAATPIEEAPVTSATVTHVPLEIEALEEPAREFRDVPDRPVVAAEADDSSAQAQIRVAAELMDSLVNYSGEISIYRARIEQQLGTVRFNLKEMEQTVERLKEQLRKMDMESEAQMLSRYQLASSPGSTEFDPLELDRFSNMQQLSRSLTESVSDLLSLQGMFNDSVRQAESLLAQQSRVSSDLQEGLMQTRMTPFGSAAPRLRRVVRAAAAETGRKARLSLRMAGSSDQLDRNVLERIMAPLEHMLRNSVVHGIETPKVRRKLDKPEEGQVTVTVEAEATEFVVRVQDDGSGVNLDAVRKRAIERGMIKADEKPDKRQLIEFILESGFSTSDTVTGLAGRGVGMDVVNSEIKQIGGSMEIASEAGKGTRFTIRIPFSLAVMQTIGVNVGDKPFLVPLNSVAGVSRMLPGDYIALTQSESPVFEFAQEEFPLLQLEPLLGAAPEPVDSENVSLLMIRSGEQKAAFRVSELQGHQEVVVKPVGPQISSIPGILGGTITGDGQVVIILDMGPVIRRGLTQSVQPVKEKVAPKKEEKRQPLVMVVDDSITMRKVTSRVLENHSLEVMTAQDGIDAIENLRDRVPDLMLLDIEMPRMDGYELAEHVRSDSRLRHIPIVMITSRAGQKHRRKARKAGANAYLTKPYQEAELVEQVSKILELDLEHRGVD
jgi:chemosensory pili system protein ChpA (sensor histidine kinase/response regulator)